MFEICFCLLAVLLVCNFVFDLWKITTRSEKDYPILMADCVIDILAMFALIFIGKGGAF